MVAALCRPTPTGRMLRARNWVAAPMDSGDPSAQKHECHGTHQTHDSGQPPRKRLLSSSGRIDQQGNSGRGVCGRASRHLWAERRPWGDCNPL